MAELHVVSGLVSKRSELAGLAQHYQSELNRISGDIKHLDATIKLFAPEFDLRTVRAKEHRERNQNFKQGECQRMILDVLRESADVITTRQIAESVSMRKGLGNSTETVELVQKTVLNVVKRLDGKGLLMQGDKIGKSNTWKIA
jgi:hypothetical protein